MSPATVASYKPVARKQDLDRLSVLPPDQVSTPEFWTTVHDEIQKQLEVLETEVRRYVGGSRVVSGRTQGKCFFLCSYRTFSRTDSDLDPVVVGITFRPAQKDVTVQADASGEQLGDFIVHTPERTVPFSRAELLNAVRELLRELLQSAKAIAAALNDPSRVVE
jgi:hypothetical protein